LGDLCFGSRFMLPRLELKQFDLARGAAVLVGVLGCPGGALGVRGCAKCA